MSRLSRILLRSIKFSWLYQSLTASPLKPRLAPFFEVMLFSVIFELLHSLKSIPKSTSLMSFLEISTLFALSQPMPASSSPRSLPLPLIFKFLSVTFEAMIFITLPLPSPFIWAFLPSPMIVRGLFIVMPPS